MKTKTYYVHVTKNNMARMDKMNAYDPLDVKRILNSLNIWDFCIFDHDTWNVSEQDGLIGFSKENIYWYNMSKINKNLKKLILK